MTSADILQINTDDEENATKTLFVPSRTVCRAINYNRNSRSLTRYNTLVRSHVVFQWTETRPHICSDGLRCSFLLGSHLGVAESPATPTGKSRYAGPVWSIAQYQY